MRMARIKINGRGAVYHCISRIVGGQRLLGDLEKEKLLFMLWQQADFSGLQVITHGLMSNHIHLLLRGPGSIDATDAELVERARQYYGSKSPYVQTLQQALGTALGRDAKRERGPLRGLAALGHLATLRDLRLNVVGSSA